MFTDACAVAMPDSGYAPSVLKLDFFGGSAGAACPDAAWLPRKRRNSAGRFLYPNANLVATTLILLHRLPGSTVSNDMKVPAWLCSMNVPMPLGSALREHALLEAKASEITVRGMVVSSNIVG